MTAGVYDRRGLLRMGAQANVTLRVIAREGGRSSIAEELMINREAAAYWIPAFAGMTAGRGCKSGRLRMRAQANVTRRVIAGEGGLSSIAEELMINREAAAYWIPAFAGMTGGAYDKRKPFAYASAAKRSSFELRASPHDGLLRCARNDTTTSDTRMGPCVPSDNTDVMAATATHHSPSRLT